MWSTTKQITAETFPLEKTTIDKLEMWQRQRAIGAVKMARRRWIDKDTWYTCEWGEVSGVEWGWHLGWFRMAHAIIDGKMRTVARLADNVAPALLNAA